MLLRFVPILAAVALAACQDVSPHSSDKVGDASSLRQVDERQRALIVARDAAGMRTLADPNLQINAPTNKVLTGSQLFGMMENGAVAAENFVRVPEVVTISGNIGIVMGHEKFTATPGSESGRMFGARSLDRRYTNIYRWEGGRWRFLARHANVVPPAAATQTPR
jgi:hypothetical protein